MSVNRLLLATMVMAVFNPAPTQSPGTLIVLFNADNQAGLLDPVTGEIRARLPTGTGPHEVVVSPDGRFAYVANSGEGPGGKPGSTISVLDLERRSVAATWEVGWFTQPHTPCTMPHGLAISRDGRWLWVSCAPQKTVFELDTRTGRAARMWNTQSEGSWMLAAARDGRRLFVPNLEGKSLSIIDRETNQVRVVPLDGSAMAVDVAPSGEVWVGAGSEVVIVNPETGQVAARIVIADPMRVQFTPDGRQAWVTTPRGVTVFDAAQRKLLASVELEDSPKGLLISPDGARAFVGLRGGTHLAVIDVRQRRLLTRFLTGKAPEGLAWAK